MSTPGAPAPNRHQKRMGPAPFASFEDLSDELDSPEDKNAASVVRLPGIREDVTPVSPVPSVSGEIRGEFIYTGISLIGAPSTTAMRPTSPRGGKNLTPRIDISRASSGSQKDSKDNTPEKEDMVKMCLEEGAVELRSSTEELDFHARDVKTKSPATVHEEISYHSHNRKDSQSSEIGLLCISGRTSRLSSIGSQGSAQSRVSNASHLSAVSGQSRSPSPHKMLLETSFCGSKKKKADGAATEMEKEGTKELEKVLLQRQHDPTEALIAEGISMVQKSDETAKTSKSKPQAKKESPQVDITITIDKPSNVDSQSDILKPKLPKYFTTESGTEFIYIPLKGPLPEDPPDRIPSKSTTNGVTKTKVRETKSLSHKDQKVDKKDTSRKSKSASPSPAMTRHQHVAQVPRDETPKYIRIKLKPDHMYEDYDPNAPHEKPTSLHLDDSGPSVSSTPQRQSADEIISLSPRHTSISTCKSPNKSPSPSLSRKSSFASLFKSKETISPESPLSSTLATKRKSTNSIETRRRSRSKSRDRTAPSSSESIDTINKSTRSVFGLFKTGKKGSRQDLEKHSPSKVDPDVSNLAGMAQSLGPKKKPKSYATSSGPEVIRIPLHSPTYYESEKFLLQDIKTSSQDSQETVIEVKPEKEAIEQSTPSAARQSSTSSENIIFSTRLGSSNELFTTKIPKNSAALETTTTAIVEHVKEEPLPRTESKKERRLEKAKRIESPEHVIEVCKTPEVEISKETPQTADVEELKIPQKEVSAESIGKSSSKTSLRRFLASEGSEDIPIIAKEKLKALKVEDRMSSESEREIEVKEAKEPELQEMEPERKGLVMQQDSFDDELPYIPTTLPQERSMVVPMVPIRQRSSLELKVCPIERPRSTTPNISSTLEAVFKDDKSKSEITSKEKLKISLPRTGQEDTKVKSPKRGSKNKEDATWFDFSKVEKPPPLPPKGLQKEWINFEEIPEKRKPPKRIQTIPSRGQIDVPEVQHYPQQENVIYTYVNPEDCKCECHERPSSSTKKSPVPDDEEEDMREDEVPLLEDEDEEKGQKLEVSVPGDRRSLISDSSIDLSATSNQANEGLQTPFTSDLGVSGSNRSSIISQDDQ